MQLKLGLVLAACVALVACSADSDSPRGGVGGNGHGAGAGGNGSGDTAGISGGGIANAGGGGGAGSAGGAGGSSGGAGEPVMIDQCGTGNASGLSDADTQKLMAGGAADGMRYLYPYDGTIFPRGLIAPTLMWEGADAADAVYVHVKSSLYELEGCYKPTAPGQLLLPQDVWAMAEGVAQGEADPYVVELSVIQGGVAKGPIQEKIVVAQATLKGSIFYNSYASKLSPGAGSVLRIVPGNDVELFVDGKGSAGCNGCHAMSAQGTRLVTDMVLANSSAVYALDPTTQPNPTALHTNPGAGFVGLTPSGDVYVTTRDTAPTVRAGTTAGSQLIETDTGNAVAGSDVPTTAAMATFSADATLLTFNDSAISTGHGLALMDYDATARKASNYRKVYESSGDKLPGWPFMLPDNKAIVFQLGAATDFSGGNVGIDPIAGFGLGGLFGGGGNTGDAAPTTGPWGNLYVLDLAAGAGKEVMLAKAMGYASEADAAANKSNLPFATDELNMNYYPTVSPVAAGGYFWVFFDSERHYGNKGLHRQLWGTAVTISASGTYTSDPSHPAFFLTGQEEGTGNHRAFTALTPCKVEGDSCKTGIDCCGGFCEFPEGQDEFSPNGMGTCHKPVEMRCSKIDEACSSAADCCDKSASCIAGYCSFVIPQ